MSLLKKNGGFTLVELIVVIAVLAILAGVAVPAYSGYVEKASMSADMQLVSELKTAVVLGSMSNTEYQLAGSAVVKLSAAANASVSAANAEDQAMVESYIQAVFGDEWAETCKLSYGEWSIGASAVVGSYNNSSLAGHEPELLNTTSQMANNLAKFLDNGKNMPAQVTELMNKYGYTDNADTTTFANAAVLTLAKDFTEKKNADGVTMQAAVSNALAGGASGINSLGTTIRGFYGTSDDDQDMANLATTAALYAYATAFSQYASDNGDEYGKTQLAALNETLNDPSGMSSTAILNSVMGTFGNIANHYTTNNADVYNNYFGNGGQAKTDADALMAVMGGAAESADALSANLSSSSCFVDAGSLMNGYLAAGAVLDSTHPAGVVLNADGSVVTYLGGIG